MRHVLQETLAGVKKDISRVKIRGCEIIIQVGATTLEFSAPSGADLHSWCDGLRSVEVALEGLGLRDQLRITTCGVSCCWICISI